MKCSTQFWLVASLVVSISAISTTNVLAWQTTVRASGTTNQRQSAQSAVQTSLFDLDSGVPKPGIVDTVNLPGSFEARLHPVEPFGELTELEVQQFDFEFLEEIMKLWLDTGCTGYNFSVYRNGVEVASGAGGNARLPVDGTPILYTEETRQEIASMSKTITAMAVIQALEDADLFTSAKVIDFLPSFWEKGPLVESLTFAGLLSFHSGLLNSGSSPNESNFGNLMQTVSDGCIGPLGPHDGYAFDYAYTNANYGLAVYLLAYLVDPEAMAGFEDDYQDATPGLEQAIVMWNMDDFVHECYLAYVRANIFEPSGVSTDIDLFDWDLSSAQVRYYNFQDQTIPGALNDDNQSTNGPRGFVMRSREVAQVMSALEKSQNVSSYVRVSMKELELGLTEFKTGGQTFHYKNGGNTLSDNRGRESILVLCPWDVQIVVNMNSRNNAWGINVAGSNRIDFITAFYLASMQ